MSQPHKSIFVAKEERENFDADLDEVLEFMDMNYSQFSRAVVMDSDLLEQSDLSAYMSREARKADKYKYLVLAVKV